MRRSIGILAVLAAMTTLTGYAIAPEVPDWDWQATFVFDSSGAITSRTLDFSSNKWLGEGSCTGWSLVLETNTSTSNTTHAEVVRVDTFNKMKGFEVQNNSNINVKNYVCALAVQIDDPGPPGDPPAGTCNVGLTGQACGGLSCTAHVPITAHAESAVGVELRATCGGADAICPIVILTCESTDSPTTSSQNVNPFCSGGAGIFRRAHCHSS